MGYDAFWVVLLSLLLASFAVRGERPVWVFDLERRATLTSRFGARGILRVSALSLAAIALLVAAFSLYGARPLAALLPFLILGSASLSLYKLVNALLPPQRKVRTAAEVLDYLVVSEGGNGASRDVVLLKVRLPELGVRILPACPLAPWLNPRIGARVPVHFRVGGVGTIYRFFFESCF